MMIGYNGRSLEYGMALNKFNQFGKIKDIDFSDELYYEPLGDDDEKLIIKSIDFVENEVMLGELVSFGCECCGYYYEDTIYSLNKLYNKGYLGLVLDRLEEVLNDKMTKILIENGIITKSKQR